MSKQNKKIDTKKNNKISSETTDISKTIKRDFAFGKQNYILLIVGLLFIILGFVLMSGGGSDNPDEFNYAMFNFRRLTLAPILILIGFAIEFIAIMRKVKN